ncbi:MAG: LysR substrate-binding domain-containing protein [Paracoccaceae bacterium]
MSDLDWRQMPSLTALRAFEATARLESFSAAARALNVTHAAVAQQVRALEDELGVALVYREGRGMALSPEGAQLAQGLGDGFQALQDAVEALRADRAGRPLKISLTPAFATQWLMPRLGDFWQKHPDIPISLEPDRRVVDMKREGFDLAIRLGQGDWPGYEIEHLTGSGYLIVAAPRLLQGRPSLGIEDMARLPWILETNWPEPLAWLESLGLEPDKLDITYMPNQDLAIMGARQGYGLYVELQALAEDDLKSGRLVEVFRAEDDSASQASYFLVTRPGPRCEALKTFMRWLKSTV